jgi:hypothetical protein
VHKNKSKPTNDFTNTSWQISDENLDEVGKEYYKYRNSGNKSVAITFLGGQCVYVDDIKAVVAIQRFSYATTKQQLLSLIDDPQAPEENQKKNRETLSLLEKDISKPLTEEHVIRSCVQHTVIEKEALAQGVSFPSEEDLIKKQIAVIETIKAEDQEYYNIIAEFYGGFGMTPEEYYSSDIGKKTVLGNAIISAYRNWFYSQYPEDADSNKIQQDYDNHVAALMEKANIKWVIDLQTILAEMD